MSETYAEAIAGEVRAEMARQQKKAFEIAEVLNVHRVTASLYLNGRRPFDVVQLSAVANWLGTDAATLMDRAQVQA